MNFKSFKAKTLFSFGVIIFLSVILLLTVFRLFIVLDNLDSYVGKVAELKNHVHRVKENENKMFLFDTKNENFIKKGISKYTGNIDSLQDNLINDIVYLLEHDLTDKYDLTDDFTTLSDGFQIYFSSIEEVKRKIQKRGFGNLSLAGELDKQIQSLKVKSLMSEYEVIINEISNSIYNFNLVESESNAETIRQSISAILGSKTSEGDSIGLAKEFTLLLDKFNEYSQVSREIGITGNQGKRLELIQNSELIIKKCEDLEDIVKSNIEDEKSFLYFGFSGLAFLQVLIAIYFGVRMSSSLVKGLEEIKSNITELSSGVFPKRIPIKSEDELGMIAKSINELTDRIEYAANYARDIGKGNLSDSYKTEYLSDAIAQAIMEMQEKLKENAVIDKIRTWRTEGLAMFANVLQENKDNTEQLCYEVISNLVKYSKANQGAFYVLDENHDGIEVLRVKAAYAYEREKFLEIEIEKGEGLIGEVWKEEETLQLTEIPEDYFMITSGLGESLPSSIVILPLIYNEQVYGVLEIASFKIFQDAEMEFLEELGRNIAGTLASAKVNQRTQLLLENSQKMQQEMREQEEMMRQNMEEMQATQDTFDEREKQYIEEINKLKNQISQ